jgi:hypothetical protein
VPQFVPAGGSGLRVIAQPAVPSLLDSIVGGVLGFFFGY